MQSHRIIIIVGISTGLALVAAAIVFLMTTRPNTALISAPPPPESIPSASSTFTLGTTSILSSTLIANAFPRNIAYGDTGPDVLLLQTILNSLGYYPKGYVVTNMFNIQTQHALLLFQNDHQLNKSGFLDLQSQALMNKIAARAVTVPASPATLAIPAPTTVSNPPSRVRFLCRSLPRSPSQAQRFQTSLTPVQNLRSLQTFRPVSK